MMPKRHVSARWQYHNVLLLVLCSSFCFQVSGCSMHNHGMEINDHISEGLSASTRNLLQMDEFPKGRYSIVDSQAFASPTVPGSLSGRLGNQTSRQYGTGGIPFTTSGAYSELQDFSQSGDPIILQKEPTNLIPWSATGKLVLSSGDWCTAALIAPNVAVTAAHCLCAYGSNTIFSGTATFISGKFDSEQFIKASVEGYFPAAPYCAGTDTCANGNQCENDLAVLSLGPIITPSTSPYVGKAPGNVAGYYAFKDSDYSYVSYAGFQSTQITALGYSANLDGGNKMIRTDSLGIQATPNQVKIGSTMGAGLGGSPFIVNFGTPQTDTAAAGTASDPNVMIAVASWYSSGGTVKIIGGSRFNKNSKYSQYSNIQTLVNTYCCTLSQADRNLKCAGIQKCLDEVSPSPPPPPPATTDWIQGAAGASCTATCQGNGKTCNVSPMNQVTTVAQALNVAVYCGVTGAETLPTYNGQYNDGPTIWNGYLQYDGSLSTCAGSYTSSARFCCCGSNCPSTQSSPSPPPSPSPPSPSPPSPSPPSPSPPSPSPPGPTTNPGIPTNVIQSGNTANSVTVTWTDGSAGNPVETYRVSCMMYPSGCSATPLKEVSNIPRGTQQAVISGLLPSTLYSCFVIANNGGSDVCSSALAVNYQNSGSCAKRDFVETGPRLPRERICGTPDPTPEQIQEALKKQIATFGTTVAKYEPDKFSSAAAFSATVPLFFYTCTQSTIPQSQIDAQVQVLNQDYAQSGVQFVNTGRQACTGQQQTDWQNNLGTNTNINAGFNYLQSLASSLQKNAILITLGDWSGSGGLLGIAELGLSTWPVQFNDPRTLPGGSLAPYNLGRTMTHETGHNLGLYHVFDSGCSGDGDLIPDTPNGNTNYQCPVGTDSCTSNPGKDAINNFMDYTDDCCMNIFSPRQGLAMQAEIQQSKPAWVN